ncbi:MAG: hypothetical protein Q8K78_08480 [Planctomycetaceae bacterium]|nr:hypothetical protein [Planctomycetaceae bacterium]
MMVAIFPQVHSNPSTVPVKPEHVGRTAMIIVGALMFGLINFAAIALFVGSEPKQNPPVVLTYFGLGGAVLMTVMRFIIPGIAAAATMRRTEGQTPESHRQQLAAAYHTKTIIGAALLEGAGFFNGVAYIITGSLLNIGAVAVLLTIMAITFPSQTQFDNWADQVQRDTL